MFCTCIYPHLCSLPDQKRPISKEEPGPVPVEIGNLVQSGRCDQRWILGIGNLDAIGIQHLQATTRCWVNTSPGFAVYFFCQTIETETSRFGKNWSFPYILQLNGLEIVCLGWKEALHKGSQRIRLKVRMSSCGSWRMKKCIFGCRSCNSNITKLGKKSTWMTLIANKNMKKWGTLMECVFFLCVFWMCHSCLMDLWRASK